MTADKVLAKRCDAIGHLIFNNPEQHNAVSLEMWDAAEAILHDFVEDSGVRVIVMSGAGGKAFVSGANISRFDDERGTREAIKHYNARLKSVYASVSDLPKPTIALINGYCLGGGLALAVACDIRFCSRRSKFGLPAARLGLGYPFQGLKRLVDTIGPGATRDIVFSARRLDAEEALAIGLVQKVIPEQDLEGFVMEYADAVSRNAPLTVKAAKIIIGEVLKDPAERDLAMCQELVDACFASEDYVEGRRAFKEKREPNFKGK